jgi:hypothetical protein
MYQIGGSRTILAEEGGKKKVHGILALNAYLA